MASAPESYARKYVRAFIEKALRDAHDWEEGIRIVPGAGRWHIEADIPTSAQSCWLDFDVIDGSEGLVAERLHAMRSGTGLDASNVYVWDERKQAWQLVADESSM